MSDRVLLVVVVNTDQPNIQHRMEIILAAPQPVEAVADAHVVAFDLPSLTLGQREQLVSLLGEDAVCALAGGHRSTEG
jgi:hypothetical protein